MKNQEQNVEIYRVSYYNKASGRFLKSKLYQSKKAFLAQSKRRQCYKKQYDIVCVCEVLNSNGVYEQIQDE
jgi:hypothetical protein